MATADGLDNWTVRASGVGQNLSGVAYGNGSYVCVGQAGAMLVSSNGNTWQSIASGASTNLLGVTFADGLFLAVGAGGTILKSTNVLDWSVEISPTTNQLDSVAYCGGMFVATGDSGTLLTSVDGDAWTPQITGVDRELVASANGNGTFVAVGRGSSSPGTVLTSSNTVGWLDRSKVNLGVAFYALVFANGVFVAIDARGIAYTSTDGISWSRSNTVDSDYVFGLTFARNLFVGVGGPFGGGSQKVVTSPDGVHWKLRPISTGYTGTLRAVAYGNGHFVAVGDKGLIVESGPVTTLKLEAVAGGSASLLLDGETGAEYRIQANNEPSGSNWTDVLTFTNHGQIVSFQDAQASNAPVRFYRAVAP